MLVSPADTPQDHELDMKMAINIDEQEVGFCCAECKAKALNMMRDGQIACVFGDIDKVFTLR